MKSFWALPRSAFLFAFSAACSGRIVVDENAVDASPEVVADAAPRCNKDLPASCYRVPSVDVTLCAEDPRLVEVICEDLLTVPSDCTLTVDYLHWCCPATGAAPEFTPQPPSVDGFSGDLHGCSVDPERDWICRAERLGMHALECKYYCDESGPFTLSPYQPDGCPLHFCGGVVMFCAP